jgi:hypothetical protein
MGTGAGGLAGLHPVPDGDVRRGKLPSLPHFFEL